MIKDSSLPFGLRRVFLFSIFEHTNGYPYSTDDIAMLFVVHKVTH